MLCFYRSRFSFGLVVALGVALSAHAAPPAAPLPAGAMVRLGSARIAHGDSAAALALSSDGTLLASSGADQNYRINNGQPIDYSIRLWEIATGRQLHQLAGH